MYDLPMTVVTCGQGVGPIHFPLRLAPCDRYRVFNPAVRAATRRRITEAAAFSSFNPRVQRASHAETGLPEQP
jgi:hypothetical protein